MLITAPLRMTAIKDPKDPKDPKELKGLKEVEDSKVIKEDKVVPVVPVSPPDPTWVVESRSICGISRFDFYFYISDYAI